MAAVTRAQIEVVYQALKSEGKEPTTRAIRTRLGDKGSLATINTVIRELEGRGTSAELSVPTPLSVPQSFVDQFHQASAPAIQSIFQLAEDHANQQIQAAMDLARQMEAERDEAEEQNRQFENRIETLDADINGLKRQLNDAKQQLAAEEQARKNAEQEQKRLTGELATAKGIVQKKTDEETLLAAEVSGLKAIQALSDQKSAEQADEIRRLKDEGQAARALADSRAQEVLKLAQNLATSQGEAKGLQVQNNMLTQDAVDRKQELDRQRQLVDKLVEAQTSISEKHAEQIERLIQMHHEAMERLLSEIFAGHVPMPAGSPLVS